MKPLYLILLLVMILLFVVGFYYDSIKVLRNVEVSNDYIELTCECTEIEPFAGGGLSCACYGDYK